jgi:hypothetical protein
MDAETPAGLMADAFFSGLADGLPGAKTPWCFGEAGE